MRDYEEMENEGTFESLLLKKIKDDGFRPIGITLLGGEETIIFKSTMEAQKVSKKYGHEGWFYSFSHFIDAWAAYIDDTLNGDESLAPPVYWIDSNFKERKNDTSRKI